MTKPPDAELPSLPTAELSRVTGGAGDTMSSMLPMIMMMMMRNRAQAAAPPAIAEPAPAPDPSAAWKPRIFVDGVEQQPTMTANGMSYTTTTPF